MHKHNRAQHTHLQASLHTQVVVSASQAFPQCWGQGRWPYVSVNIHKAQARTGVGANYGLSKLQADTPRRQLNHTTHQDTILGTLQALLLAAAAARGNAVVSHLGLVAGNISQPDRGRGSILKPPQALASFFWQTGQPKRLQRSFPDRAGEGE